MVSFLPLLTVNSDQEAVGVACTDHSDCTVLGHRYGCLLYKCVDFKDEKLRSCSKKLKCPEEESCIRTYLPPYPEGFCQPTVSLNTCTRKDDCSNPDLSECCGKWCCPKEYFSQWQNFSCFSHSQCREWRTGQFCCPDSQCCQALPDYQDYYDYDYHTLEYSTEYYSGHTEQSSDAFKTSSEAAKDYDFFPVKNFPFLQESDETDATESVAKDEESEEVDIVSLKNTSDSDGENIESNVQYEVISNAIDSQDDDKSVTVKADDVDTTAAESNETNIYEFFPSEHILLSVEEISAIPETTTSETVTEIDSDMTSLITKENSLENVTTENISIPDISENIADMNDVTNETPNFFYEDFSNVNPTEDAKYEGSGLELPEATLAEEGSTIAIPTEKEYLGQDQVTVTTEPSEQEATSHSEKKNIKSVKLKVNVKSADIVEASDNIIENKLHYKAPEEIVSDLAKHKDDSDTTNVLSEGQNILNTFNGIKPLIHSYCLLFTCLLFVSLSFKCSFLM